MACKPMHKDSVLHHLATCLSSNNNNNNSNNNNNGLITIKINNKMAKNATQNTNQCWNAPVDNTVTNVVLVDKAHATCSPPFQCSMRYLK